MLSKMGKYRKIANIWFKFFFICKNFYGDKDFQNMFAYQPKFSSLVLKEDKGIEHIIACKPKVLFKIELYPLYNIFLPNV